MKISHTLLSPTRVACMIAFACLFAASLDGGRAFAADAFDVLRADPAKASPPVQYPDFAAGKGSGAEEIKKAVFLTNEERDLLITLEATSIEQLVQLIAVYDRLGNGAMAQAIAEIVERRAPGSPDAGKVREMLREKETIRKPDFLDQEAAALLKTGRSGDPDAVDAQARYLLQERRVSEAAMLLEKLRVGNYTGRSFPYLDTLASCYFDLKRWDDALAAWMIIERDPAFPEVERNRAPTVIKMIELEKNVAKAREETFADPAAAVIASKRLLDKSPEQPAAIAFHLDALHYAGRDQEAMAFVKSIQANWKGPGPFPYQRLLAHCHMNLKQWDQAREAFGSMIDDPVFDDPARKDASRGMMLTDVARTGEAAIFAAEKGEEEQARRLLAANKASHPDDLEALGYEASVLARLGEKDKALELLQQRKHALAGAGPFPLQDALGNVLLERKEYDRARAAFQEMLDDKRYDWDQRQAATKGLAAVRRTEILDEAYRALRDRRTSTARELSAKLRSEFAGQLPEGDILDAEILLAENKVVQARAALGEIEAKTEEGKVFHAQTSLASAQLRSGEWQKAADRYQKILAHPLSVTEPELRQAKWEKRDALELLRPSASASIGYRQDDDGRAVHAQTSWQSKWQGHWRAATFAKLADVSVTRRVGATPQVGADSFVEAGAKVQRVIGPEFATEVMVGVSGDEAMYAARVGNFLNPGLRWSAGFTGNARSEESVLTEASGVRENRAEARLTGPLPGPWNVDIGAYGFWMNDGGASLGNGYGVSALLEYVLQAETATRPEIGIGYAGHWQDFRSEGARARSLFDGEVNQHGLQLEARKAITDRLRASALGGAYYALDEESTGYLLGGSVQYHVSDRTSFFADLRYNSENSSASSAAGSGSGAFEASLGASMTF